MSNTDAILLVLTAPLWLSSAAVGLLLVLLICVAWFGFAMAFDR